MILQTRGLLSPSMTIGGKMLTNANGDIDTTSSGYQYMVDTLTQIRAEVIEQKFYKVAPGDFIPLDVGYGAYMDEIVQNIAFQTGGDVFAGDVDTQTDTGRLAQSDVALAPLRMPTQTWAKQSSWTILTVAKAMAASNWDVISSKMESVKTDWDLLIQEVAFLGHPSKTEITGLINDPEVNVNNTLVSKPVRDMTSKEFQAFVGGLLSSYVENSQNTEERPDTFVMPSEDYFGLVNAASESFPNITKIEFLKNALASATDNANFTIKPLAYCQSKNNAARGISKNRYVLYKNDAKSMKMSIPIDFVMLEPGTQNNMNWVQPAYGQYSGLLISRKREVLYFDQA